MAIRMSNEIMDENGVLTSFSLELDNGDVEKYNEIIEKWRFKDAESLFRFAISILNSTKDNFIATKKEDNKIVERTPNPNLIRE